MAMQQSGGVCAPGERAKVKKNYTKTIGDTAGLCEKESRRGVFSVKSSDRRHVPLLTRTADQIGEALKPTKFGKM